MTKWHESDNPGTVVRGAAWRTAVLIIAVIVFAGLITAGVWAVKVATSNTRGAGDTTRRVNSADNRIAAQERFHTMYEEIRATDRKLDQAAADKAANPKDQFAATNYTGLVQYCHDIVGQYNAETAKITAAKWRDPELPFRIDDTNPETDCKETRTP